MIIVVSGEGPTDIGCCANSASQCEGGDYRPGAMGMFIDRLVEPIWNYSPLTAGAMICLRESELGTMSRRLKVVTLPGKNKDRETGYFFKNSYALGIFSKHIEEANGCQTMAVLFRDADGTCSTRRGIWEGKMRSITRGFEASGYMRGVPMLPKPKSEAWLLCALQDHPYQNCLRFEQISGNDHSPNSAKMQLDEVMSQHGKSYADVPDLVTQGIIAPDEIEMPSFHSFRSRLEEVAVAMITH